MPLPALAGLSIGQKFAKLLPYLAIALAVALVLTLAYCQGKSAGKNEEVVEQLEEELEVVETVLGANEAAAGDRVTDTQALGEQQEELEDARTHQGDDAVTRRARSLCSKLRQQGGDTSNHPTCCRFEGDGRACPASDGVRGNP